MDALSYLREVKEHFKNDKAVYDVFLEIMKEFKARRCAPTHPHRTRPSLRIPHAPLTLALHVTPYHSIPHTCPRTLGHWLSQAEPWRRSATHRHTRAFPRIREWNLPPLPLALYQSRTQTGSGVTIYGVSGVFANAAQPKSASPR